MSKFVQDCEEFYLHLSSSDARQGSPSNFVIGLPAPRVLNGRWRLALKELTYTSWYKERSENDEFDILVVAPSNYTTEFLDYIRHLTNNGIARVVIEYPRNTFPGLPNARMISVFKHPGRVASSVWRGPEGQFESAEQYVSHLNSMLNEMHELMGGLFHEAPYFYLKDRGLPFQTVECCWHYGANNYRKIGLVPLGALRNRHLLGIPGDHTDPRFIRTIATTFNDDRPDISWGEHGFTSKTDNMVVCSDLVRTTGAHATIEGQILRIIPNRQKESGVVVHYDFTEDYYEVTPKSSFFSLRINLLSSRTYQPLNLVHPVSLTLHFIPVNECKELTEATATIS